MVTKFIYFLTEGRLFGRKKSEIQPEPETQDEKPVQPVKPVKPVKPSRKYDKPDDDIVYWIIDYLTKNGLDEANLQWDYVLSPKSFEPKEWWKYKFVKVGEKVDVDPYGEEDWPGKKGNKEISIYIKKHSYSTDKYSYYYTIDINNERMDASESLVRKLCELLDEPRVRRREARKRREEEEKKMKHDRLRGDLF